MNIPKTVLSIIIIAFIGFSCKKSQPLVEENVIPCEMREFTEFGRTYSLEYDANRLPTKTFLKGGSVNPVYQTFEYTNGVLTSIHRVDLEGVSYPEAKFEYKNGVLNLIRKFDGTRYDFTDPTYYIKEIERIEFKYSSQKSPSLLIRWLSDEKGEFFKSHESEFEYSTAGNLVTEKMHTFARQNVIEADYLYEYFYDNKPNTQKHLNSLFLSATDSPPKLFSSNNLNRIKLTYESKLIRDEKLKLTYDTEGNVVDDGYRYSKIIWNCK